ncbi:carbohydrate ABC transporter permease [Streptomyces sp. NPDC001508]|uniref:carbohydrate ABC transporter permease n=1 Tax=Streptomyces sp. NPDC001508 TaxID=3154656 RepID=UPI00332A80AD
MTRRWLTRSLTATAVIIACLFAVFPFAWMLRTSVASADAIVGDGLSPIPRGFDLSNYVRAWNEAHLGRAMVTGVIVTIGILAIQLLTCIPAAYAFAKLRFRGKRLAYYLVLAALLVPAQATALPLYIGVSRLGMVNTLSALIVPFGTSAFGLFLLRQHMLTIPDALIDAARSDGLGTLQTIWRVIIPSSRPAIATFSLFSVFFHWNDYLWPLLVARSQEMRTPPLALATFAQSDIGNDFGALSAGAVIITVPILILFLAARRRFVAGIAGGELPG